MVCCRCDAARAGITRDKYSANKSSHHPSSSPCRPSLSAPSGRPPCPALFTERRARGWSTRPPLPPAIFNKSSRVPTMASNEHGRGEGEGVVAAGAHSMYSTRVLSRATRAHALSLFSLLLTLFFAFSLFCACFTLRYRSIFFAFFGRRWIARQLPIRII